MWRKDRMRHLRDHIYLLQKTWFGFVVCGMACGLPALSSPTCGWDSSPCIPPTHLYSCGWRGRRVSLYSFLFPHLPAYYYYHHRYLPSPCSHLPQHLLCPNMPFPISLLCVTKQEKFLSSHCLLPVYGWFWWRWDGWFGWDTAATRLACDLCLCLHAARSVPMPPLYLPSAFSYKHIISFQPSFLPSLSSPLHFCIGDISLYSLLYVVAWLVKHISHLSSHSIIHALLW